MILRFLHLWFLLYPVTPKKKVLIDEKAVLLSFDHDLEG